MTFISITAGIVLIALVGLALSRLTAAEAAWFSAVVQATDEELFERGIRQLKRDVLRMDQILQDISQQSGITRSHVTRTLALEQRGRLEAALAAVAERRELDLTESARQYHSAPAADYRMEP